MNKLVSIITPAFNSADVIEKCILSVKNQTYNNIEHIIIDGGSTDNTKEILTKYAKEYNLKWVSEKDKGIADAMNKGFKMAAGDVFAWIDADNSYDFNIVDDIVKLFEQNNSLDIIYGNVDVVNGVGNIFYTHKPPQDISFKKALTYCTGYIPVQPAVFFKKELFENVGGFDTKYKIAGDYDFWLRVLKLNPAIFYYDKKFGNYVKDERAASQSAKGVINGYKEVSSICSLYKQSIKGKILTIIKYLKGYVSFFVKNK